MSTKLNSREAFWVFTLCLCGPLILVGYIVSILKTFRDRQMILTIQKKKRSIERRRLTGFGGGSSIVRVKRSSEPRERETEPDHKDHRNKPKVQQTPATRKTPPRKTPTPPRKSPTSPRKSPTPDKHGVKAPQTNIVKPELKGIPYQEVTDYKPTEELKRGLFDNSNDSLGEDLDKDVTNNALVMPFTETDLEDGDGDRKCTCGSGGVFGKCKFTGHKAIERCNLPAVPRNIKSRHFPVSSKACSGKECLQKRLT